MNRSKLSLRRPLAILGAMFVGLAAAVSFAAPASAHDADLSGDYKCLPSGHWQVSWTLNSGTNDHPGTLDEVHYQPDNPDAKNIKAGATLAPDVALTEVLLLPGDTKTASLSVKLTFGKDRPARWRRASSSTARARRRRATTRSRACRSSPTATARST